MGSESLSCTLRVVPAPISAALANALARLRGCIWFNHRSALGARVFVLLVAFRDRPFAGLVSVAVGFLSRGSDWLWTVAIIPSQVMAMMLRSGEIGNLWPLALILSAMLSAPFVVAAFVASRFRRTR